MNKKTWFVYVFMIAGILFNSIRTIIIQNEAANIKKNISQTIPKTYLKHDSSGVLTASLKPDSLMTYRVICRYGTFNVLAEDYEFNYRYTKDGEPQLKMINFRINQNIICTFPDVLYVYAESNTKQIK